VPELASGPPGELRCAGLPELRAVVLWNEAEMPGATHLGALRAEGAKRLGQGAQLDAADPRDPVIIVYTSGTTGHPKGAMHGHSVMRNVANVARVMHIEPDDVILGHMPFYHVAGAFTECVPTVMFGTTLVTLAQWIPDEALETIERERVTIFGGIPTHFIDCLMPSDAIPRRLQPEVGMDWRRAGHADVAMAAREELGCARCRRSTA
jgi:fatty-acyl-CoA synthase